MFKVLVTLHLIPLTQFSVLISLEEGQIDLTHMAIVKTVAEPIENVQGAETRPKPSVTDKHPPVE